MIVRDVVEVLDRTGGVCRAVEVPASPGERAELLDAMHRLDRELLALGRRIAKARRRHSRWERAWARLREDT